MGRVAWRWFGVNSAAAFRAAYVVTRPPGASFSGWISKLASLTGLDFGNGRTAIVFAILVLVLVVYLVVAHPDVKPSRTREGFYAVGA